MCPYWKLNAHNISLKLTGRSVDCRGLENSIPVTGVRSSSCWRVRCRHGKWSLFFVFTLTSLFLQLHAWGQTASPAAPPTVKTAEQQSNSPPLTNPANGSPVQTIAPEKIDPAETLTPDYFIASVSIDAEVVGERVEMEATVEIVINRDVGWQRIPLRFDQAHIWSREYSGPGEEAPDLVSGNGSEGVSWMLKGKGKHLLKFSMWVPYRRSIIGSQLLFTLPPLSNLFDTKFKLTVPDSTARLRTKPNLEVQNIIREADQTVFETSVSMNRLDAVWTVPQNNARVVSKAVTKFHLKPSVDSLLLTADQSIELQQQDARELVVKLPSDFPLASAEVNQSAVVEIPDRPGWVKIKLNDISSGKVDLHWEFRKQLPQDGERIRIDGLEIEGAAQEAGSIRVDGLEGYRIMPQLSESRLVNRVGLGEMASSGMDSLNSFYEYLQQPFRLVTEIRPVDPLHSVSLIHELKLGSKKMELKVHQLIEIERGAESEFTLNWSQFEAEGWTLKSSELSKLTLGGIRTSVDDAGDTITFKLTEPLTNGERLHLVSTFDRSISIDDQNKVKWTFPKVHADQLRGRLFILQLEDHLEATFDEVSQSSLSPPLNNHHLLQLSEMWGLPDSLKKLLQSPQTSILNESASGTFQASLTEHEPQFAIHSTVEIQDATPRDLLIYQSFDLNIQYGRIQSLELSIPKDLMDLLSPAGVAAGISVLFEGEPITLSIIGEVPRIDFPREIIGVHSFELQYRFPIDSSKKDQEIDLPVISLPELPFSQIACLITPVENVQLLTANSNWIAAQTFPKGPLWIQELENKSIQSIPLQVGGGLSDSAQQYFVEHAYFWTHFEADGRAKTLARFEILSPPSRLVMTIPVNSEFVATIDGESIAEDAISQAEDGSGQVILNLPDGFSDRRVLEFQYLTDSHSPFSFAEQQTFEFPQFAKSVWINETVWEVQLPFGFHLFEYPGLKPLFNWKRHGLVWEREPTATYYKERQSKITGLPDSFRFEQNYYAFRGFSPVSVVRFRSMNRSLILLIGAGFALLLGFVFYRFPVTRNVFSLVVLAFVFAVVSVWYLEPLLLLLQPAIIGVILALTATLIDLRTNYGQSDKTTGRSGKTASSDTLSGHQREVGEGTTRIFNPVPPSRTDSTTG